MNARRLMGSSSKLGTALRLQDDTLHKGLGVGLDDIQKGVIATVNTLPDVRSGSTNKRT
jgi:hypothetical protein